MVNPNGCRYTSLDSLVDYILIDLLQVTGLLHDLGKLLVFFGSQGQWDVVGVCA